jgi:uncharacterized membrane protein (DUF4010 family)
MKEAFISMNSFVQDTLKFLPEYLKSNHALIKHEDIFILLQELAIAIFIGLLVGLEREHSRSPNEKTFAGIRTFPLISILGFISALISIDWSVAAFIIIFLGFASLVSVSHVFSAKEGRHGATSEVSALIVFLLGALVCWDYIILAAIIAVILTTFLTLKIPLHKFVGKITEEDLYATVKLAVISVIILPLLPNKPIGPLNILNPRMIWLMVIFVSGISYIGYILTKTIGTRRGIAVTGLLGGLVSSTATTFSLSKKSNDAETLSKSFAVGIVMASSIMFLRTLVIILVFNKVLVKSLWIPLLIFMIVSLTIGFILKRKVSESNSKDIEMRNPFILKSALIFGLLFAIIIFISKAVMVYLGDRGIYAVSALAGITSLNAIILTISELFHQNLNEKIAIAGISIALISNTLVKAIIPMIWGSKELSKYTTRSLGIIALIVTVYLIIILI